MGNDLAVYAYGSFDESYRLRGGEVDPKDLARLVGSGSQLAVFVVIPRNFVSSGAITPRDLGGILARAFEEISDRLPE